jgi:hypothetical protein
MPKNRRHTHPCATPDCNARLECDGELLDNFDGHPEVVCDLFHRCDGTTAVIHCDTCEAQRDAEIEAGTRCRTCLEPLALGDACGDCLGGTSADPQARSWESAATPFARDH